MEYYKVYCPNHPYELITNFCAHGKPPITQSIASLDYVPPASVITHNLIYKKEPLRFMKTSRIPTLATMKR